MCRYACHAVCGGQRTACQSLFFLPPRHMESLESNSDNQIVSSHLYLLSHLVALCTHTHKHLGSPLFLVPSLCSPSVQTVSDSIPTPFLEHVSALFLLLIGFFGLVGLILSLLSMHISLFCVNQVYPGRIAR